MSIFQSSGSDKRTELIEAVESKEKFYGQKPGGKDVEYFSPETGFVLLRKNVDLNTTSKYMLRASVCAQLSLGVPLELREFYYIVRNTPNLVEPFKTVQPKDIYHTVLKSLNTLEVLADIDRSLFTVGNLTKGFIFDAHSTGFAEKERKVAFTEVIARTLADGELDTTQNIIVLEKLSAATRLVDLGFSELTNSCIVTVGGNFSRGIWYLTDRFKEKKNLLFMADGDVYGDDMLRGIEFGTINSCHLPFKFPPSTYPNVYLTGLYPSVGERLDLPNDVKQKRPLNNKYAKERLDFLDRFGLIDKRDIEAWNRNKTFELEALSSKFVNDEGKPVGLAAYLIEYMRLKNIPIKPPLPPDKELKEQFDRAAKEELFSEIYEEVDDQSLREKIIEMIHNKLWKKVQEVAFEIYKKHIEALDQCLEEVGPKEIKFHINKQYIDDPSRKTYDMKAIAHLLKTAFSVDVEWNSDDLFDELEIKMNEFVEENPESWDSEIEFTPIHNESSARDVYDLALEKIGVNPEDAEKVREALEWRFGEE